MAAPVILVVDDELPVLSFVERALASAGYRIETATTGVEALRMIEARGRFDAFVVDVTMPDMLGPELVQHIRRTDPEAKILYFTGYVDRLFEERRCLWADEAFIEKPVRVEGLREALSLLLYGHMHGPTPSAA